MKLYPEATIGLLDLQTRLPNLLGDPDARISGSTQYARQRMHGELREGSFPTYPGIDRVGEDELIALYKALVVRVGADEFGDRTVTQHRRLEVDRFVATHLFEVCDIAAWQATRPALWVFMTVFVAPEFVVWRFPESLNGSASRFLGSKKNCLRRLYERAEMSTWWKGTIGFDALAVLGEDEWVQILERPNAATYRDATGVLVRAVIERAKESSEGRSSLLRESMKLFGRYAEYLSVAAGDPHGLTELAARIVDEAIEGGA